MRLPKKLVLVFITTAAILAAAILLYIFTPGYEEGVQTNVFTRLSQKVRRILDPSPPPPDQNMIRRDISFELIDPDEVLDSYIYAYSGMNDTNADSDRLLLQHNRRSAALFKFSFPKLGKSTHIKSAFLELFVREPDFRNLPTLNVYRIHSGFDWTCPIPGGDAVVEGCENVEAENYHPFDDENIFLTWEDVDLDRSENIDENEAFYDSSPVASVTIGDGESPASVRFDLKQYVSDVLSGSHSDEGVVILHEGSKGDPLFHSSESSDAALRPRLLLTIEVNGKDSIDNDGDGRTTAFGDCDDTDSDIYPGAEEICDDGIDQDCDGDVDENCEITIPGESDLDGDTIDDASDNCPNAPNPDQADSNGDGTGDACTESPKHSMNLYHQASFDEDNPDEITFMANHVALVNSNNIEGIKKLKDENPDLLAIRYVKFLGVKSPDPNGPYAAEGAGYDCCKDDGSDCIEPDWPEWSLWEAMRDNDLFWRDENGALVTQPDNGWCFADILDENKRELWIEALKENMRILTNLEDIPDEDIARYSLDPELINGIFLDNSSVPTDTYISIGEAGMTPIRGQFYDAIEDIYTKLHEESWIRNLYVVGNAYNHKEWADEGGWKGLELLGSGMDSMMRELFSFKADGGFLSRDRLVRSINDFRHVINGTAIEGVGPKDTIILDRVSPSDIRRRLFSTGIHFLLMNPNGGTTYHWFDTGGVSDFPEYDLDLGLPLDSYDETADLFVRHFENGTVAVNPDPNASYSLEIGTNDWEMLEITGGGYYPSEGSLSWETHGESSYTLGPDTAVFYRLKKF